jgi:hypothetical protein
MAQYARCRCQQCGAKYKFPPEAAGRRAKCKECGAVFRVPVLEPVSLEDSVIMWLDEIEETEPASNRPRIVTSSDVKKDSLPTSRRRIPLKQQNPTEQTEQTEKQG